MVKPGGSSCRIGGVWTAAPSGVGGPVVVAAVAVVAVSVMAAVVAVTMTAPWHHPLRLMWFSSWRLSCRLSCGGRPALPWRTRSAELQHAGRQVHHARRSRGRAHDHGVGDADVAGLGGERQAAPGGVG